MGETGPLPVSLSQALGWGSLGFLPLLSPVPEHHRSQEAPSMLPAPPQCLGAEGPSQGSSQLSLQPGPGGFPRAA